MAKRQQAEALKAAIFRTFNELQEPGPEGPMPHSLIEWARANPGAFYTGLLTRLLPKPVELSAADGAQFMLVYQIGDERVCIGDDGKPCLPDPDVIDVEAVQDGQNTRRPSMSQDPTDDV